MKLCTKYLSHPTPPLTTFAIATGMTDTEISVVFADISTLMRKALAGTLAFSPGGKCNAQTKYMCTKCMQHAG